MSLWITIAIAFRSLLAHRLRSFLTALGVVIGIASVIAMLGLGSGTREKVTKTMRQYGANLLIVRPQYRRLASGVRGSGKTKSLSLIDAETILKSVPGVEMVNPDLEDTAQVKFGNKNKSVSVSGEAATYFTIRNYTIEHGRGISDADVVSESKVAVLGPKTADDLFEDEDPLGQTVKINGMNFVVIGTTARKGSSGQTDVDENIWIPYTTAMGHVLGQKYLDQIYIRVASGADVPAVQQEVIQVMRRSHAIQASAEDDFQVRNNQEMIDQLDNVATVFTTLLAGIAAASLLVGGINIMNVMLVSVTERTREIGVRKALGAREYDLMAQFLSEALALSLTGGMIGIALGTGAILAFNEVTLRSSGESYGARVEFLPIVVSFAFSVGVGAFFGWYPARKAALLDPIEALRYE